MFWIALGCILFQISSSAGFPFTPQFGVGCEMKISKMSLHRARPVSQKVSITSAVQLNPNQKCFLLTASKDHLDIGKQSLFIQQKHPHRIEKIRSGDYVVLYAGKARHGEKQAYQKIVSVCQATDDKYDRLPRSDGSGFFYRKKVCYLPFDEIDIRSLIPNLSFIKNKARWGFYFMSGFSEIGMDDLQKIMKEGSC
jgi:predicted RNA-binding protein